MHLALYQPDIPQNLGTILRLCACMGVTCHVIEPCGFPLDDKRIKRSGMDYLDLVNWQRHSSWEAFVLYAQEQRFRLVLLTTKGNVPYTSFVYTNQDVLLMGRESAGVPHDVAETCPLKVTIPMQGDVRSLNVAMASAMVVGEAIRQIRGHEI